jgi:hypothetical protein
MLLSLNAIMALIGISMPERLARAMSFQRRLMIIFTRVGSLLAITTSVGITGVSG